MNTLRNFIITLNARSSTKLQVIVVCILIALTTSCSASAVYNTALYIPPLAEHRIEHNSKVFSLQAERGTHHFSKEKKANTLYYTDNNASAEENNIVNYLGPTLRFANNDTIELRITNNINDASTFHQHGLHLPAASDGGPYQAFDKNTTWTTKFSVKQVAGTFWYHPHKIDITGYQVTMGMAGLIIVDDEESSALPLPNTYGVDDIPLIVQDKIIIKNKIQYSDRNMHSQMMGNIGKALLTNGSVSPEFEASRTLLRLRILNGSSFGIQAFYFSDKRNFYLIANDGGLLETPVPLSSIVLAPSERREILVDIQDLSPQESISLLTNVHGLYDAEALRIRATQFETSSTKIPATLVTVETLNVADASNRRTFNLESITPNSRGGGMMGGNNQLTINGKSMDMNRIDETIRINSTEIWTINNIAQGGMMANLPHSFHPHHGSFQVLSFNNAVPPPELTGWKDTILLLPGESVEIIMRFEDYTGVYMYHCHQLEHEDAGMMGTFEIVD